jgi:putative flippase GtrA
VGEAFENTKESGEAMGLIESALGLWRNEQVRYLVVGGWNTLFGYACFALGYALFGHVVHYLVIATLVHGIAVTQSFLTQRTLVFRSRARWLPEYLRFHVSHLGLLGAGLVAMPVLVELVGLSPLVAQAAWILLSVVGSYVVHKSFSFRHARRAPSRPPPTP